MYVDYRKRFHLMMVLVIIEKIFHLMMKNCHLLMALVIDKNFILLKKLSPHDGVGKIQLFSTLHVGGYFRF